MLHHLLKLSLSFLRYPVRYDRLVEFFLVQLVLEELLSMFLSRLVVQFLQMWVFLVLPSVVVLGLMQYEVLACSTVLRGLSAMRGAS